MSVLSQLNRPELYLICGGIILFIAIVCVVFIVRAWRMGKRLGMDVTKMKRAVTASATFSVLPSVGILLGELALSGSILTRFSAVRQGVIERIGKALPGATVISPRHPASFGAAALARSAFYSPIPS